MKLPRTRAELKNTFPQLSILIDAMWREMHDANVIEDIEQTAHGFLLGQVVRQGTDGVWVLAQSDTLAHAKAVGIVCRVKSADLFWVRTGGLLPGDDYDAGARYFLSDTTAGDLMAEPETWEAGDIKQFIGTGTGDGLLVEIGEVVTVGEEDNSVEVTFDFITSDELFFIYNCPHAMIFTSQEYENSPATVNPALGTPLAQFDKVTITVSETGGIVLKGQTL